MDSMLDSCLKVIKAASGTPVTSCEIASLIGESTCDVARILNSAFHNLIGLHRVEQGNAEAWFVD